jgi:hypothetical protein
MYVSIDITCSYMIMDLVKEQGSRAREEMEVCRVGKVGEMRSDM